MKPSKLAFLWLLAIATFFAPQTLIAMLKVKPANNFLIRRYYSSSSSQRLQRLKKDLAVSTQEIKKLNTMDAFLVNTITACEILGCINNDCIKTGLKCEELYKLNRMLLKYQAKKANQLLMEIITHEQ